MKTNTISATVNESEVLTVTEASRMTAVGSLIGYAIGSVDMLSTFGTTFGNTQFKQMTVIAALSLIGSVLVTSYAVKERVLISVRCVRISLILRGFYG